MHSKLKLNNKEIWLFNQELHRDHFKPAIISNNNEQYFIYNRKYTKINDYLINQDDSYVRLKYKNKNFIFLKEKSTRFVYTNGTIEFQNFGRLHNYPDPAVIYPNGDTEFWVQGIRHRDDGPAVIYGNKHYYFRVGEFIKFELNPSKI